MVLQVGTPKRSGRLKMHRIPTLPARQFGISSTVRGSDFHDPHGRAVNLSQKMARWMVEIIDHLKRWEDRNLEPGLEVCIYSYMYIFE